MIIPVSVDFLIKSEYLLLFFFLIIIKNFPFP